MPPQQNATLLQVSRDGQSDDWDATSSTGSTVWSGSASAYVQEKIRTNYSQQAGAMTKTKDLQIVLDEPFVTIMPINSGHILTFTWRGQTLSRRVMEYNSAIFPGVPNYIRVHLNPEPVEVALESE